MAITAALVKELRDITNAGMMECKNALVAADGNIEKAIKILQEEGLAKAQKKASRVNAEGTLDLFMDAAGKRAALVEVNCETDFVAREARFKDFADLCAKVALDKNIKDVEQLKTQVEQQRLELVTTLGENITVRRLALVEAQDGNIGSYKHGDGSTIRIATLVVVKGGDAELARDLAMQVAAMQPEYLTRADIPDSILQHQKEIFIEQTRKEGKPDAMLEKIADGKLKKFVDERSLLGQVFVKDSNKTIAQLLQEQKATVLSFVRFAVGEGIEKKQENFAEEVMAQVNKE